MRKLYLIRHGKTIVNEKRLYCGISDISLSENGVKELESLTSLYKDVPHDSIFICSSLKRTHESLKVLFGDVDFIVDKGLDEMNFGEFELKSHEELLNNPNYVNWLNNPSLTIPGGGNPAKQKETVYKTIRNIINKYKDIDKDVVIVAHGGTISYIVNYLENTNYHIYELQPKNGRGYVYDFKTKILLNM